MSFASEHIMAMARTTHPPKCEDSFPCRARFPLFSSSPASEELVLGMTQRALSVPVSPRTPTSGFTEADLRRIFLDTIVEAFNSKEVLEAFAEGLAPLLGTGTKGHLSRGRPAKETLDDSEFSGAVMKARQETVVFMESTTVCRCLHVSYCRLDLISILCVPVLL